MVKKTQIEERIEKLEQGLEGLTLEFRTQMAELRHFLEQRPPKCRDRHRRKRKGSGITGEDGGEVEGEGDSSSDEVSYSPARRHRYKGRKLEIPVFEGGEAYGWLVKVERYFRINGVEEDEMLEAVVIALDGRALNWYQWWAEQNHEPSWDEFKQAVIRRFQPALLRNPLGPILNVKQTGTVMEYREQFELLVAPLKSNERVMLESIFLNELREEIQAELKLHQTKGLNALMDRALLIEEQNLTMTKGKEPVKEKNEASKWKSGFSGSGYESGRNQVFITEPKSESGSSNGGPSDPKKSGGV